VWLMPQYIELATERTSKTKAMPHDSSSFQRLIDLNYPRLKGIRTYEGLEDGLPLRRWFLSPRLERVQITTSLKCKGRLDFLRLLQVSAPIQSEIHSRAESS